MCGGFVGDILEGVGDIIEDVGDAIGDAVEAVVDNPIGAIVSVGSMAMGIPPVWAGALGGAANAAANDGNILEGALLGGATGFVGGAAASAAGQAGANSILAGAAGGAAAGATGAALTGGDILQGALTGGALGGATSFAYNTFTDASGNTVYQYDDGSTITRSPAGDAVSSTPAPGQPAPVYEYNPATGRVEQYNPNGQINILDAQQTAELMRNVDPNLINSLQPTDQPFRVEISGAAGTAEAPQYANQDLMTPGSSLANQAQIDAGQATWNPNANAWEVGAPIESTIGGGAGTGPGTYKGPETYTFDDGSTFTINSDGSTTFTDPTTGQSTGYAAGHTQAQQNAAGGVTYTYDDGTWLTINPDGSSAWTDTLGTMHSSTGGTYSGQGNQGGSTPLNNLDITAPVEPTDLTDATDIPHHDVLPDTGTDTGAGTETIPGGEGGWNPASTINPPVFPVIPTGGTGEEGGDGGYTPSPYVAGTPLNTYGGLNPGLIQAVPQYMTTSPVQARYYHGDQYYQAGPTFNTAVASRGVGQPDQAWGLQQMFTPLTPQDYANIVNQPMYQQATYQQQVPYGAVAPTPLIEAPVIVQG